RLPRRDDDEAPLSRGAQLRGGAGGDPPRPRHGLLRSVRRCVRARSRQAADRPADAGARARGLSAVSYGERIRRVPAAELAATARAVLSPTVCAGGGASGAASEGA